MEDFKVIEVSGFDKDGEPQIRIFNDGHIEVMFEYMPPLNGKDDQDDEEFWDSFDDTLAKVLGVNVTREDRELFTIDEPKHDTPEKIKNYLENYWS